MFDKTNGAHPPAPIQAGAPEQPGSPVSGARRCRTCGAEVAEPGKVNCQACRALSAARQRERRRNRAIKRYQCSLEQIPTKRKKPAAAGRRCATEGCPGRTVGKALYCQVCRHARRGNIQRAYRHRAKYVDPLPQGPPTSLDWLSKFSGWARSGLSYGEYQTAEREKKHRKRQGKKSKKTDEATGSRTVD